MDGMWSQTPVSLGHLLVFLLQKPARRKELKLNQEPQGNHPGKKHSPGGKRDTREFQGFQEKVMAENKAMV